MSATPALPSPVGPDDSVPNGHWLHELRNELNTAMMAAAAARQLLQTGDDAEALANIRRTEAACQRCARLLHRGSVRHA